jgi:murein DD-endopeptidase MepM/ murein hydrolase activator NlpD
MSENEQIFEITEEQDLPEAEMFDEESAVSPDTVEPDQEKKSFFKKPSVLRIGIYSVSFIVMVLMVWGIGSLIINGFAAAPEPTSIPTETAVALPDGVSTPVFSVDGPSGGVVRLPEVRVTSMPTAEDRDEVTTYVVERGDTIFGIAEKFGLKPETVLWSNRYILGDTPDGLAVGQELNIIPVDGVYHKWSEGEGLNGVAEFYGVNPDVIVNYSGNNLSPETVGNYSNPNIPPDTMLIVPGGTRPSVTWVVARDEPASGNSYLGPGACGGILYGDVGTGTFTWPTTATWLSGYDYTPPVHNGLDFDGDFGSPIYAADSGVIVYSGWSDRGYGNLIVVDHAGGWQTFYAHMIDGTLLPCGSNVQKGQLIASMGSTGNSTGPHLHFELRLNGYPVNPWQFLN